ncbi:MULTISPECIES: MliC family protein [unclassified Sphingomonas]|jgi:membrane-bound inhibitor of C-type lysozyme|uniref:MliC family protein n=1 Tax=unclassified Sphingomonas TaxID=196159 RepID=UPI000AD18CC8|nr:MULTISPECIES: MliC family protein [unclassified Sphingomonas]
MRLPLIALLALGACSSQPPVADTNVAQTEVTNITDDASPAPVDKAPVAGETAKSVATGAGPAVRFRCMDGVGIVARFDPDKGTVDVTRAGRVHTLEQQRMASGIRYSDGQTTFQGKGDDMSFEAPGQPPIACTAIH